MSESNLPAVRHTPEVATTDTDSWIQTMGPIVNLAKHIAATDFVPKGLRNNPAAVAAAILYGREVGLPPMTSLTQTHVIEGKPAISAEGMRAMVLAAGHELVTEETTGAICRMRARRRNSEEWTTITWSLDMARAAGLAGKGVWKAYPRAMLQARCTAELARLVFPDVLHGFRALEEVDDVVDASPASGFGETTASSTVQRRGRTAKKTAAKAIAAPQAGRESVPDRAGIPLPGEEGFDELAPEAGGGESVAGGEAQAAPPPATTPEAETPPEEPPGAPEPDEEPQVEEKATPDPRPASAAQKRMLHGQFNGFDLSDDKDREERLLITSKIVGRAVSSSNDLTKDEASSLIDTLSRCQSLPDVHAVLDALDAQAEAEAGDDRG